MNKYAIFVETDKRHTLSFEDGAKLFTDPGEAFLRYVKLDLNEFFDDVTNIKRSGIEKLVLTDEGYRHEEDFLFHEWKEVKPNGR